MRTQDTAPPPPGGHRPAQVHIGHEIRTLLRQRGLTVVWLARELSYTRANIYKLFDKSSLDSSLLLRISLALHFDFFSLYTGEFQRKAL